jgi:hypothetical protein
VAAVAARRRLAPWAGGAGIALVVAVWLPWFHRHLSAVFSPVRAEQSISGWSALGGVAAVVLVLAAGAVAWGVVGVVPALASARQPSPFWLVLAGGLALVIEVSITVDRVGAAHPACCGPAVSTTTPGVGLAVALAAAMVVVLAGLGALLSEARRRSRAG